MPRFLNSGTDPWTVVCRDAHFEAMRKVLGTHLQVEQV